MVQNTGKKMHTSACKPVDLPKQLTVEEKNGLPHILNDKRRYIVIYIDDMWRLDDEWWRKEPISRLYFAVTLSSFRRLTIFKDLLKNRWYRQSY